MGVAVQIVCGRCGSADVVGYAVARWDTGSQSWAYSPGIDGGDCSCCGADDCFEERALDEWNAMRGEDELYPGKPNLWVGAVPDATGRFVAVLRRGGETGPGEVIWTGRAYDCPREAKDEARTAILADLATG